MEISFGLGDDLEREWGGRGRVLWLVVGCSRSKGFEVESIGLDGELSVICLVEKLVYIGSMAGLEVWVSLGSFKEFVFSIMRMVGIMDVVV